MKQLFPRTNPVRQPVHQTIINPPAPVSFVADKVGEDGVLLRYMAPTEGRVSRIVLRLTAKKPCEVIFEKTDMQGVKSGVGLTVNPGFLGVPTQYDIKTGDVLLLRLVSNPTDIGFDHILISFIFSVAGSINATEGEVSDASISQQDEQRQISSEDAESGSREGDNKGES